MTRATRLAVLMAALVCLGMGGALHGQIPPYGGAAELRADLTARRARAMAALGSESILVAWSAPARVYSTDVNYEYRQESHLLYLSNMTQEDTILVRIPGARTKKERLFTREADPRREHCNGHTPTAAEVTADGGVMTDAGLVTLSAKAPRLVGDIEKVVGGK